MKKIILTLFLVTFHVLVSGQETKDKFSFEFKESTVKSVIETIEKSTNYVFYFDEQSLNADKTLITENFKNNSIEEILNSVLNKTDFNFLIQKNRIIVTKNRVIYDKLQDNYFNTTPLITDRKEENEVGEKPVFETQRDTINSSSKKDDAVTLIGRQTKTLEKKALRLSGYIRNSKTGEVLSNVIVRTLNKTAGTVSNDAGFFSLELPSGTNTIEILSSNYKRVVKKVVMYNNGILNVRMVEEVNQL